MTDSATIRFSSSLLSEKRTPKSRAQKKIFTAIAGRRFTRRSIFFWVLIRIDQSGRELGLGLCSARPPRRTGICSNLKCQPEGWRYNSPAKNFRADGEIKTL